MAEDTEVHGPWEKYQKTTPTATPEVAHGPWEKYAKPAAPAAAPAAPTVFNQPQGAALPPTLAAKANQSFHGTEGVQHLGFDPSHLAEQGVEGLKQAWQGAKSMAGDLLLPGSHPGWERPAALREKYITGPYKEQQQKADDIIAGPNGKSYLSGLEARGHKAASFLGPMAGFASGLGEQAGTGDIGGAGARAAAPLIAGKAAELPAAGLGKGVQAIRDTFKENPDIAAAKAFKKGAGKSALRTEGATDLARPYFKGITDLKDFQDRTPAVKTEVWKGYADAQAKVGNNTVHGPDGPNTVNHYEAERLKTSAQLDALRSRDPIAVKLAEQKGGSEAELIERDKAIKAAIDPELAKGGIDPQKIRTTFGAIKELEKATQGRSTLTEKPIGTMGRLKGIDLTRPATWLGPPKEAITDLLAGRRGLKPTDVKFKEGFRTGGAKPDFSAPTGTQPNLPFAGPVGPAGPLFEGPQAGPQTPYPTIGEKFAGRPTPTEPTPMPPGGQYSLGHATPGPLFEQAGETGEGFPGTRPHHVTEGAPGWNVPPGTQAEIAAPGPLFEHTGSIGEKQRPVIKPPTAPEVPKGTQGELTPTPGSLFNAPTEPGAAAPKGFVTMGQAADLRKLGYPAEATTKMSPQLAEHIIKHHIGAEDLMKQHGTGGAPTTTPSGGSLGAKLVAEPGAASSGQGPIAPPKEIMRQTASTSRATPHGGRSNIPPELHADLEKQWGGKLTNDEAMALDRSNLERGMGEGGEDKTSQIREEHRSKLEKKGR